MKLTSSKKAYLDIRKCHTCMQSMELPKGDPKRRSFVFCHKKQKRVPRLSFRKCWIMPTVEVNND